MPKISIIVPIYNVEIYLAKCLDSILRQTLQDIEIILVDDGSPDRCPQICDEYAQTDPRIKVIHKSNGGYGKAVNSGLDVATGEYIGIVESDDWIDETMYEKLYAQALSTNADVVKCSFYSVFDIEKNILEPYHPWLRLAKKGEIFTLKDKLDLLKYHHSLWSAIYKRELACEVRFVETPGATYQDWPFVTEIYVKATAITMVPEPLLYYKDIHDENCSSYNGSENMLYILYQARIGKDILKKNGFYNGEAKEVHAEHEFGAGIVFLERIAENLKDKFYCELRKSTLELAQDDLNYSHFSDWHKLQFARVLMHLNYSDFSNSRLLEPPAMEIPDVKTYSVRLLGFIPIMKVKKAPHKTKFLLFSFFPLIKIKNY